MLCGKVKTVSLKSLSASASDRRPPKESPTAAIIRLNHTTIYPICLIYHVII